MNNYRTVLAGNVTVIEFNEYVTYCNAMDKLIKAFPDVKRLNVDRHVRSEMELYNNEEVMYFQLIANDL